MEISLAIVSNIGKVRKVNQDKFFSAIRCENYLDDNDNYRFFCNRAKLSNYDIFAVFDGMGGLQDGDIASRLAVNFLSKKREYNKCCLPADIINELNGEINKKNKEKNKKMGSTAVLISFEKREYQMANIGDSRCYLFRNEKLLQLSEDHTEIETIRRIKQQANIDFAKNSIEKSKNVLTQYLGISKEEFEIEPYCATGNVKKNDIFIICSDGLTSMVTDSQIEASLASGGSLEKVCERLEDKALENGGTDNITFMLIKVL